MITKYCENLSKKTLTSYVLKLKWNDFQYKFGRSNSICVRIHDFLPYYNIKVSCHTKLLIYKVFKDI